jgi:hypothetical protein
MGDGPFGLAIHDRLERHGNSKGRMIGTEGAMPLPHDDSPV